MFDNLFADVELITFSSSRPFYFGDKVTIMEKNKSGEESWTANILLSSGEIDTIYLSKNGLQDENLIIFRCRQNGDLYDLQAIEAHNLENMLLKIDADTMNITNT